MELFLKHVIMEVDADADNDAVSHFMVERFIDVEKSEKCADLISKVRCHMTPSTYDTNLLRSSDTSEGETVSD